MAKLTAWLVTIIGVLLVLSALKISLGAMADAWLIPIIVLVIGVSKLIRNYSKKKR